LAGGPDDLLEQVIHGTAGDHESEATAAITLDMPVAWVHDRRFVPSR
jgi:hypothetical protein